MKVKILKSKNKTTWYTNMINQVIDVNYDIQYIRRSFTGKDGVHCLFNDDIVITELPESFCVKRCDDVEKWKKYIKWLNKTYNKEYYDNVGTYYGCDMGSCWHLATPLGTEIHIDDMIKHIDYMESQQHINGGEQFSKESQLIAKMDKILKEETNMNTQKLSRKGLKEIHSVACPTWKTNLENYSKRNTLEDYIVLTNIEVDHMFNSCTKEQLPIVSKYLKQDDGSVDVTKFTLSGKGFCDDNFYIIRDREWGEYKKQSFLLSERYDWEIKTDDVGQLCLIPTKKK